MRVRETDLRVMTVLFLLLGLGFMTSTWRHSRAVNRWDTTQRASRMNPNKCRDFVGLYAQLAAVLDKDPSFIRDYARCLRSIGKKNESVALLTEAAGKQEDPTLLEEAAAMQAKGGQYPAAIESAREAVQMFPWRLEPQGQLLSFYRELGREDQAYELARRILVAPTQLLTSREAPIKERAREVADNWKASDQWSAEFRSTLALVEAEWRDAVARALWVAGDNAQQICSAYQMLAERDRPALTFLVTNMPETDLSTLTAELLVNNFQVAKETRELYPFARQVPDEIFLRYVVPYSQLGEAPEAWRLPLRERLAPALKDVRTIEQAIPALIKAFPLFGVEHETFLSFGVYRARNPSQSMDFGYGDCFGGAVMFADVLRAAGVPARVVVIPVWYGTSGGHAWVEAYVKGTWHPIGIFDETGIGWFLDYAARTLSSNPANRIFAASFERTDITIPVFGPHVWWHDVTDRYLTPLPKPPRMFRDLRREHRTIRPVPITETG